MFVLVYWPGYNQKSIIPEESLCSNANEGEVTEARYSDGKTYSAKILKKSFDKEYLKCLIVSKEGELLPAINKPICSKVYNQKSSLQLKRKQFMKNRTDITFKRNKQLIQSRIIFSENSSEDDEITKKETDKIKKKEIKSIDREASSSDKDLEESDYSDKSSYENIKKLENINKNTRREPIENQERSSLQIVERVYDRERSCERESIKKRTRENENDNVQNKYQTASSFEDDQSSDKDMIFEEQVENYKDEEQERRIEEQRERERKESERRKRDQAQREREQAVRDRERRSNKDSETDNEEDPLEKYKKGGNGRIKLCKVYNVWIDAGTLTYFQRFFDNPKEMTRRLLKVIVGKENLKGMCARGRSKNTRRVPEDILNAVEYYVNKKCSYKLKPVEFTNVVNMMCSTLRNQK